MSYGSWAQFTTAGYVLDSFSKEPLEGVSVFFDGTTIGTITNEKGYFEISSQKSLTASLIISYIGFETKVFDGGTSGSLGTILLTEKVVQLDGVIVGPDTWSRQKKIAIFRREFLGKTIAAHECKIQNEDDIRLYYNSEKQKLYAYANEPIRILNKHLGYLISYNLQDFEVGFSISPSGLEFVDFTSYSGVSFFTELKDKPKKKHIKNRGQVYLGSILHFMRSLRIKQLRQEKFKIFKNRFEVAPYTEIKIAYVDKFTQISILAERLDILYNDTEQSSISVKAEGFLIDEYGNHMPPQGVLFGGKMGTQRVANMFPLNYAFK